jgi:hypothetical protein
MGEIEVSSKIYHQEAIIPGRSDIAKHKTSISKDCPVTIALDGAAQDRIGTAEGQQISMKL